MSENISLRTVETGQEVIISKVTTGGELGRRIRDLGLVPGVTVRVMGRAPLKDPVALRLLGYTLSLRNSEADYILVNLV